MAFRDETRDLSERAVAERLLIWAFSGGELSGAFWAGDPQRAQGTLSQVPHALPG